VVGVRGFEPLASRKRVAKPTTYSRTTVKVGRCRSRSERGGSRQTRINRSSRQGAGDRHRPGFDHRVLAGRIVYKLDAFTDQQRAARDRVRHLIWWFYSDLKAYCRDPIPQRKAALRARFDRIFTHKTGFATLDRLLARLFANKAKPLMALDCPTSRFIPTTPKPGRPTQAERRYPQ
jgi:hypothetical protein